MIRMEEALDPWVAYLIVPLFALANAGVQIDSGVGEIVTSTLGLGVILGLVAGKQIGIMAAAFLVTRLGLAELPERVTWRHIYGMAWLGGIGFTVSLFITDLAFDSSDNLTMAKIGILTASVIAACGGYLVLRTANGAD
ncbi:MAG: Na+/H+ antiporter NhaA [Thermomicrobiales bacterium]